MRKNIYYATCRVLLGFFLRFALTRMAISWVGVTEYGLWVSVSASLALIGVITEAMASSVQRHLTADIAAGNVAAARATFSASCVVFSLGAFLLLCLGCLLKGAVLDVIHVPVDRVAVTEVLYYVALAGVVISVLFVPHQGILVAAHRQDLLTIIQVAPNILLVFVLWFLQRTAIDPLYAYGWISTLALTASAMLAFFAARVSTPVARLIKSPRLFSDVRRLIDYASWDIMGRLNWALRNAGTVVLLSSHFGNQAAASFSVANSLVMSALQLNFAWSGVVQAEMTAAETCGEKKKVGSMASRFSLIQSLFGLGLICVVFFHGALLLRLWLKTPPEGAHVFMLYAAVYQSLSFVSMGEGMIMLARGKIRGITLIITVPQIVAFIAGASFVILFKGSEYALPACYVMVALLTSFLLKPLYLLEQNALRLGDWGWRVLFPTSVAAMGCLIWSFLVRTLPWADTSLLMMGVDLFGWALVCLAILRLWAPELFDFRQFRKYWPSRERKAP